MRFLYAELLIPRMEPKNVSTATAMVNTVSVQDRPNVFPMTPNNVIAAGIKIIVNHLSTSYTLFDIFMTDTPFNLVGLLANETRFHPFALLVEIVV